MNAYSVIVDSKLLGTHLPRCLATLGEAGRQQQMPVDIQIIGPTDDVRLTTLSRRFGARVTVCDQDTIGARGNAAARTSSASTLVFLSPHGRLRSDWLDQINQPLAQKQWDAVIFQPHGPALLDSLRRLWHVARPPGTLCIARQWFERIGGFDPALDSNAHEDLVERLRACHARIMEVPL